MKKLKAYMAHSWASQQEGAYIVFAHYLEMALPEIEQINPFTHDLTQSWIKSPHDITIAKAIVRKDLEMIQECDIVIAYLPDMIGNQKYTGSIGTSMEIWYARHTLNKPVYALSSLIHPWILALGVKLENNIDVLIERLKTEMQL